MNFRVAILFGFFSFVVLNKVNAQTENDFSTQQIIESLSENVNEDFDYSELTERLNYYKLHPININDTNPQQLSELGFLTTLQINTLMQHIRENGDLLDLLELQGISDFDPETIANLLLFVYIKQANAIKNLSITDLSSKANHDLLIRYGQLFQKQEGFKIPDTSNRSRYLGSANRFFVRYRYSYGENISFSLNLEKDAGEQFMSRKSKGFDFYSGSLAIKNIGKINKLVIGDYSLQFGQGLSLWSGLSFGKGASVTTLAKQDAGLKAYTSVNEFSYLRGLAATISVNHFVFTPFISYQNLDASMSKVDSLSENDEITSLGLSGLHRTQSEISNKKAVSQLLFGSNIQYAHKDLKIGFNAYQASFNRNFEVGKALYKQFEFAGKSLTNFSTYYSYAYKNTYFFGELAHSITSGYALVNGLITSLSPKLSIILLYRHYDKDFHSLYNQSVSESSSAINERGFYTGLTYKPIRTIELSAYADRFEFPWLKYGVDAPSKGYDLLSQLSYTPNKKLKAMVRFRFKQKEENDDVLNTVNVLQTVGKYNYRFKVSYKINKSITLRNRVEFTDYQKENTAKESGYLMYQDVIYDPMQSKFSGNIRFAIFDTNGFNSRIYAFENDVLYSYSVLGYQNSGTRCYVNGRYILKRGLDVWCRWSFTNYANLESIGSGLDKIDGHIKSDIKLQLRYQF
ncbi:MAG: hypothetical protein JWN56_1020 [Sphingobacteriales bacterium]|nr:hypothetical protein [Sphingobacteriales bacterium]